MEATQFLLKLKYWFLNHSNDLWHLSKFTESDILLGIFFGEFMTMDVLANIAKQYFYSPDGELSPAGVAAVGSVLTAIGGGTVF